MNHKIIQQIGKNHSYTTMTFPAKHINNSFMFLVRVQRTICSDKRIQVSHKCYPKYQSCPSSPGSCTWWKLWLMLELLILNYFWDTFNIDFSDNVGDTPVESPTSKNRHWFRLTKLDTRIWTTVKEILILNFSFQNEGCGKCQFPSDYIFWMW